MKTVVHLLSCGLIQFGILLAPNAAATPILFGVDEDDSQIFAIENYDSASPSFIDFGRLQFNGVDIPNDIEAMTLAPNGTMFLAIDDPLGGFEEDVLLRYDTANLNFANPGASNLNVTAIGTIGTAKSTDNVSGLSIDPLTGDLFALSREGGTGTVDRLFRLADPNNNPGNATLIGELDDGVQAALNGEDLEFDEDGRLYVADDRGQEPLFEIVLERDPVDDSIIDILSIDLIAELQSIFDQEVKFEALGWDFENDRLIGSTDRGDFFATLLPTAEAENLGQLGGSGFLTDVEGIDFVPLGEAPPPPVNEVPAPSTILLASLGAVALITRRRRASVARCGTAS